MEEKMGKKILITGMAGFLGTHVADYFMKQGWEVRGIDNLTAYEMKRASFDNVKVRQHNVDFLNSIGAELDVNDCRSVTADYLLEKWGTFDLIIHCSAQPAMTIALEDPKYDADDNIISVVNMLEVARKLNVPFVNCSSIHVYGNKMDGELTEGEFRFIRVPEEIDESQPILNGELTPLHVSKYATELYTQSFAEMYGMKTASFRFTGLYGERQFGGMDHGWVANFAIKTIMNREITIFGTDKQVRDILYAGDAAKAFHCWFKNGCPQGVYNIGGGIENAISIAECLFQLKIMHNCKNQNIKIEPKRKGDLWYFVCDYKKAKKEFKWEPETPPKLGLLRITRWIKENKELMEWKE